MAYTETTTTSYGGRIWNSIAGAFIGVLLIIGSVTLLWWNEGRTIDTAKWLSETEKITVAWGTQTINPELENKLVYNTGMANTDEVLKDVTFQIGDKAIHLIRTVEMYQWNENSTEETKDNLWWSQTTTTTYTYNKTWTENPLSSSNYKESGHENPASWKYSSDSLSAQRVSIDKLILSTDFINQISNRVTLPISKENGQNIINSIDNSVSLEWNYLYIPVGTGSLSNPQIGDLRINFQIVKPAQVSVIGQQRGDTLYSYTTSRDTQVGLLEYGNKTQEEMFQIAQDSNSFLAWVFRWVWLLLMYFGFSLVFGVLTAIWKVIPFVWSIIGFGVWVISFFLTLILWIGTIVVAWFFVRPILSLSLIAIVAWIIYMIYIKKNK